MSAAGVAIRWLKVAGTFATIALLWSLWSSPSVSAWFDLLGRGLRGPGFPRDVVAVSAVWSHRVDPTGGVWFLSGWRDGNGSRSRQSSRPGWPRPGGRGQASRVCDEHREAGFDRAEPPGSSTAIANNSTRASGITTTSGLASLRGRRRADGTFDAPVDRAAGHPRRRPPEVALRPSDTIVRGGPLDQQRAGDARPPNTSRGAGRDVPDRLAGDSIAAGLGRDVEDRFESILERTGSTSARVASGGPAVEILDFSLPGRSPWPALGALPAGSAGRCIPT